MTVSLNPPELGQLQIQVQTKGNQVAIEIISESEAARAALEGHVNALRSSLGNQDLVLTRMDVQVNNEPFSQQGSGQSFQNMGGSHARDSSGNGEQGNSFTENRQQMRSHSASVVEAEPAPVTASSGRVNMTV